MINKKLITISISLLLTLGSLSLIVSPSFAAPMVTDAPMMNNAAPADNMGPPMSVSPTGMMGEAPGMMKETATPSANNMDQQDITLGQNLYLKFKGSQTPCQNFSSDDFEKIGAYMLNQQLGAATYTQMGQMMQDPEKQQVNIAVGKNTTNCTAASIMPALTQPMMDDNNKPMTAPASTTSPLAMYLEIGAVAAILLNVLLTIILLSKVGKTGSKSDSSGPKTPPSPTPAAPVAHPAPSLFPSGTPTPPTPQSHTPAPISHTPIPPMPEHTIPQQSHDVPPKPQLFS